MANDSIAGLWYSEHPTYQGRLDTGSEKIGLVMAQNTTKTGMQPDCRLYLEVGACWKKDSDKGIMWSGKITVNGTTMDVVLFPNDYKQEGDNKPDIRMFQARPKNGDSAPVQEPF